MKLCNSLQLTKQADIDTFINFLDDCLIFSSWRSNDMSVQFALRSIEVDCKRCRLVDLQNTAQLQW